MITPAIYLLASIRNILRDSLILAAGVFFIVLAFAAEPCIRNHPPLRSKWAIALWKIGFSIIGLAAIIATLYSFGK
jgi:hypothetical protein